MQLPPLPLVLRETPREIRSLLTAPKEALAALPLTGGLRDPVVKALVYGLATGAVTGVWALCFGTRLIELREGLAGGAPVIDFVLLPMLLSLILLFCGAALVALTAKLCNGSGDYEASLRLCAALAFLAPVQSLTLPLSLLSFPAWIGVSLCLALYFVWLLMQGFEIALAANPKRARIAAGVWAVLFLCLGALWFRYPPELFLFKNQFLPLHENITLGRAFDRCDAFSSVSWKREARGMNVLFEVTATFKPKATARWSLKNPVRTYLSRIEYAQQFLLTRQSKDVLRGPGFLRAYDPEGELCSEINSGDMLEAVYGNRAQVSPNMVLGCYK